MHAQLRGLGEIPADSRSGTTARETNAASPESFRRSRPPGPTYCRYRKSRSPGSAERTPIADEMTTKREDGWGFASAKAVLRLMGEDAASKQDAWDPFVRPDSLPSGMPLHAIVVGIAPQVGRTPRLNLLRASQTTPYTMSPRTLAIEGYQLLTPPALFAQIEKSASEAAAAEAEHRIRDEASQEDRYRELKNLIGSAKYGLAEKLLAYKTLDAVPDRVRLWNEIRVRSPLQRHRVTHCMNCRSDLDSEVHILECSRCSAIVCPSCTACGCGDSRFLLKR